MSQVNPSTGAAAVTTDPYATTPGEHTDVRPVAPTAPPGYELLEEVGRGNMGVVLRARDNRLGRVVAVKRLQDKYPPDSPAARRFLDEARITGRLQHPGIPPVHEVGELPDGRPFLAMKLIRGQTLAELLAAGQIDRGGAVAAFEGVCQAVAYAHDQGVVHRDLKPQNIMVGAFGEVQVMDWGLAKILSEARSEEAIEHRTDRTLSDPQVETGGSAETEAGAVMGTPSFMPPEQARGEPVGPRADVFALGGILSVILTGHPPYTGATARAVLLRATEADLDPALARLDSSGAEPELVALCKRCLNADRDSRPRDAGEVAAAVRRFRAEAEERARQAELVRARTEAKAAEQRKRRRVQLALAAAVGLLLVGGVGFAWWQDREQRDRRTERDRVAAERRDTQLRQQLEDERRAADERARLGRNADALSTLVGDCERALKTEDAEKAVAALAEIDRRLPEGGGDGLGKRVERCRVELAVLRDLDAADELRWTLVDGHTHDLKPIMSRLHGAYVRLGIEVGKTPAGEAAVRLNQAVIRDRLLAGLDLWLALEPSATVRDILGAADPDPYRNAVREAVAAGKPERITQLAEQKQALEQPVGFADALGLHDVVPPERRREILWAALLARPGNHTLLMELGISYPIGRRATAGDRLRWFQAALAARPHSAAAHNNLGLALSETKDPGALACFEQACRLAPQLALAHSNLGLAHKARGDLEGALAAYRKALELDPKLAVVYSNLSIVLMARNDPDGAVAACEVAIRLDPELSVAHNNLGLALKARGDRRRAEAAYREAIRLDPEYAGPHANLGALFLEQGDLDGAEACFRKALEIDPSHAMSLSDLGIVQAARGDLKAAIAYHQEAIQADPTYATAYYNLGIALRQSGDVDGAIAAYQEAIRLEPGYANAHYNLAIALEQQKRRKDAIAAYREAIRLDPKFANAHVNLGIIFSKVGEMEEAIECYRQAIRIDPDLVKAHYNLGHAFADMREWDAALACYLEAILRDPKYAAAYDGAGYVLAKRYAFEKRGGDLDRAIHYFQRAVALDPKSEQFRTNLRLALHGKAERDEREGRIAPPPRHVTR